MMISAAILAGLLLQTRPQASQVKPGQWDRSWFAASCTYDAAGKPASFAYAGERGKATRVAVGQIENYGAQLSRDRSTLTIHRPGADPLVLVARPGSGKLFVVFSGTTPNLFGAAPFLITKGSGYAMMGDPSFTGPAAITVTIRNGRFDKVQTAPLPNACWQFTSAAYDLKNSK